MNMAGLRMLNVGCLLLMVLCHTGLCAPTHNDTAAADAGQVDVDQADAMSDYEGIGGGLTQQQSREVGFFPFMVEQYIRPSNGDKRNPMTYSFGLGKRNRDYNFGLGKRSREYSFGLGKRVGPGPYNFGLGKRSNANNANPPFFLVENEPSRDVKGTGNKKQAPTSRFGFGLGKRSGSDFEDDDEDQINEDDIVDQQDDGTDEENFTKLYGPHVRAYWGGFHPAIAGHSVGDALAEMTKRARPMKLQPSSAYLRQWWGLYGPGAAPAQPAEDVSSAKLKVDSEQADLGRLFGKRLPYNFGLGK